METNKLILACLITLCSLPVAAQVKLGLRLVPIFPTISPTVIQTLRTAKT